MSNLPSTTPSNPNLTPTLTPDPNLPNTTTNQRVYTQVPIASIYASSNEDKHEVYNVIDGFFETYWKADNTLSAGQFFTAQFPKKFDIASVDLSFRDGIDRVISFQIEALVDEGKRWELLKKTETRGSTNGLMRFNFGTVHTDRVKVSVYTWHLKTDSSHTYINAEVSEFRVFGYLEAKDIPINQAEPHNLPCPEGYTKDLSTGECIPIIESDLLKPVSIIGSAIVPPVVIKPDEHDANNVLTGSTTDKYVAQGTGSYVIEDLGKLQEIFIVDIGVNQKPARVYNLNLKLFQDDDLTRPPLFEEDIKFELADSDAQILLEEPIKARIAKLEFKGGNDEDVVEITRFHLLGESSNIVDPPTPPVLEKPKEGKILHGGWGGNVDFNQWKVVPMKKPSSEFKIVDAEGVNIATNFTTEDTAKEYISYYSTHPFPPEDAVPPVDPTDPPVEPGPVINTVGPYRGTGKQLESTTRGPTTRNYASGKPSDETIEKNVKNIPYVNYQFIVETTINEIEHDDTLSVKFGGQHTSGKGWFDCGVSFEEGQTCLGTEPDHPETHLCLVKGPKIGSILGKKLKVAGVYIRDTNHIELWTNLEGAGWIKQCEGNNVGDLSPDNAKGHECQERIDGFAKDSVPELHLAIVQEIDATSPLPPVDPPTDLPPQPPVEPPVDPPVEPPVDPVPPVPGSGVDKNGVKLMFAKAENVIHDFQKDVRDNGDGIRWNAKIAGATSSEAHGYFRFTGSVVDDEVSIKWSEMSHSGSNDVQCYDTGVKVKTGAARMRFENPHPEYSGNIGSGQGVALKDKFIGYKGAKIVNADGTVTIKLWQDTGDNEGAKPANQWKEIYSHTDSKYKRTGAHPHVTVRIDDPGNNSLEGIEEKWLGAAKV